MRLPIAIHSCLLAALIALGAARSDAATVTVLVTAQSVKPLIIAKVQDLDLGGVTLGPGLWSNVTISLSRTGVLTCTNPNVTCSGATLAAEYDVQGSGQQTVQISAPNVTMTNQSDPSQTLTLVTDAPATIVLQNSGLPGTNFWIGGSVTLSSSTAPGTYVGTFNVTVDY